MPRLVIIYRMVSLYHSALPFHVTLTALATAVQHASRGPQVSWCTSSWHLVFRSLSLNESRAVLKAKWSACPRGRLKEDNVVVFLKSPAQLSRTLPFPHSELIRRKPTTGWLSLCHSSYVEHYLQIIFKPTHLCFEVKLSCFNMFVYFYL